MLLLLFLEQDKLGRGFFLHLPLLNRVEEATCLEPFVDVICDHMEVQTFVYHWLNCESACSGRLWLIVAAISFIRARLVWLLLQHCYRVAAFETLGIRFFSNKTRPWKRRGLTLSCRIVGLERRQQREQRIRILLFSPIVFDRFVIRLDHRVLIRLIQIFIFVARVIDVIEMRIYYIQVEAEQLLLYGLHLVKFGIIE